MEREWLVPSVLMTLLLGVAGLAVIPDYSSVYGALTLFPLWIVAAGALAGLSALPALERMRRAGVASPTAHILQLSRENWRKILFVAACVLLAGLNMIIFMWCKPLLNYLVPFRADPLLAQIDYYLFLGHDPWTFLGWLNSRATAIFYHRAWFALMVMTLLMVLSRRPSPEKSAVMVTYFLLWSVAGPAIHLLIPAAGPVFYADLGYGDRFAAIPVPAEMTQMSEFLWAVYSGDKFAPGAGISAMPSLHIATTVWMVIAVFVLARRWAGAMAAVGFLIFLLSISLGWHYAVDGIVGGGAAALCYLLARRFYSRRYRVDEGSNVGALAPAAS